MKQMFMINPFYEVRFLTINAMKFCKINEKVISLLLINCICIVKFVVKLHRCTSLMLISNDSISNKR